jgi:hypothetical protein
VDERDRGAIEALISDLHWQIDQIPKKGIKNAAGHPYYPSYYIRGLDTATEKGGLAVRDYVRSYLYKPPSDGFVKFEEADALELVCEALVVDDSKPYAYLFTDQDRQISRDRLAPHRAAIDQRKADGAAKEAERQARIQKLRAQRRATGGRLFPDLDDSLRSRRQGS